MTKKSISLIVIFVFFFSICGCNKQNKINYNLNYIKDTFDGLGYQMADCKEGKPIPTYKGYIPDDHIFVKGLSIENCDTVEAENLSAHDILIAECDIK